MIYMLLAFFITEVTYLPYNYLLAILFIFILFILYVCPLHNFLSSK